MSRLAAGEVRVLARLCRLLEEELASDDLLDTLHEQPSAALVVGITGAPGVGKSSLVSALTTLLREAGQRVAVVAVDPTSPFSGGAILGDRIRMQQHSGDAEVFIRSVATRGALGGLSPAIADLIAACSVWGADTVLVETVGVGQDELDIMEAADCTVVVVAPGLGDDVQAAKAGILEIADVFVVNKADRIGAASAVSQLRGALAHRNPELTAVSHGAGQHHVGPESTGRTLAAAAWEVPVLETVATEPKGVDAVLAAITARGRWLSETAAGRAEAERRLGRRAQQRLRAELHRLVERSTAVALHQLAERLARGEIKLSAARRQLASLLGGIAPEQP